MELKRARKVLEEGGGKERYFCISDSRVWIRWVGKFLLKLVSVLEFSFASWLGRCFIEVVLE